ncbi:MAG: hypothetical protein FJ224_02440 [Lentisphaerae bacterium]|nr:hypothetical protein [Lentisphaerota bacterium]
MKISAAQGVGGAVCLMLLLSAGCVTVPATLDGGPIVSRLTTLDGATRVRALGPVYEKTIAPGGDSFFAVRPLYSELREPGRDRRLREYAWPVGSVKDFLGERYWRFGVAYGLDKDIHDASSRYQYVLFPLVVGGRDGGGRRYFAFVPFGGEMRDFAGLDRITFCMFPLYVSTRKGDLKSSSWLWPVFSRTRGEGQDRFRVFPFYGRSVNSGRWEKRFVMWPFWSSVRYDYPGDKGGGFIFFPFLAHIKTERQNMWMAVPPFFQWGSGDGGKYSKFTAAWPIVQKVRGPVKKTYFFPLWGKKEAGRDRSWFVLWPVVEKRQTTRSDYRSDQFRIAPVLSIKTQRAWADEKAGIVAEPPVGRYVRIWPLVSYSRQRDAATVRVLDAWPGAQVGPSERNWAPFWTVYTHERRGEAREDEAFWGLFRFRRGGNVTDTTVFPLFRYFRDRAADRVEWTVLCGMFGGRREGLQRRMRLLFLPVPLPPADDQGLQDDNP